MPGRALRLEFVLFDVEQRAQVLADALAVRDADRFVFQPAPGFVADVASAGDRRASVRPIDDDAQHHPDRFTPELDVETSSP